MLLIAPVTAPRARGSAAIDIPAWGLQLMDTIVITNQKGGVGKTTIAALLAWWFAEKEKARVALLDLDSQKNLTLSFAEYQCEVSAARLFEPTQGLPFAERAPSALCLFAGGTELADLERASAVVIRNFRNNLAQLRPHFDYCLIDTPPCLGLRMMAALIVADHVLCPIELEEYAIDGVTAMIKTIVGVRQRHNPRLNFLGLLANRFNAHSLRQREALPALLAAYGQHVIPAKISTRSAIPEALSQGVPVWRLPKSSAREATAEIYQAFGLLREKMRAQAQTPAEVVDAET
jgi:chromosome partitioning protein